MPTPLQLCREDQGPNSPSYPILALEQTKQPGYRRLDLI